MVDAGLAAGHQRVQVWASDEHRAGAEGNGGRDVGAGPDAAVEVDLGGATDRVDDAGKQLERRYSSIELPSAGVAGASEVTGLRAVGRPHRGHRHRAGVRVPAGWRARGDAAGRRLPPIRVGRSGADTDQRPLLLPVDRDAGEGRLRRVLSCGDWDCDDPCRLVRVACWMPGGRRSSACRETAWSFV